MSTIIPPYNPKDALPQQFGNVHCVALAEDGLLYVCDRTNDRIQVFKTDGTFVKEAFIAKNTLGRWVRVRYRVFPRSAAEVYLRGGRVEHADSHSGS